jgi:hypothetical protein
VAGTTNIGLTSDFLLIRFNIGQPDSPGDLTALATGEDTIDLAWTDNSDDETNFRIERSTDGATDWAEIDTVTADTASYSDTSLACEQTRFYRVRAYHDASLLYSDYSNTAEATTTTCPTDRTPPALTAPKNGAAIYKTPVKLTWKSIPEILSYHVTLENVSDPENVTTVVDTDVPSPYFPTDPLPMGSYRWKVRVQDSAGWSVDTLPFTFDVTLLKTPAKNGAVSLRLPKFAWQKVTSASQYHLQLFTDPDECFVGDNVLFEKDTIKPTYAMKSPDAPLALGHYFWRVRASAGVTTPYTPCWPFDVTTLKAPKNGSIVQNFLPKFGWAANKAATGYLITVSLRPDGGGPDVLIVDHKPVTAAKYAATVTDGLGYGHYIWTVQEIVTGLVEPEMPAFTFDITNMSKPSKGSLILDTTPTFTWKTIKGETGYTLEIATDSEFTTVLHSYDAGGQKTFTVPPEDSLQQGTYFWRVRTTGTGNFTMPAWAFTVGP